ncbi:MAG: PEP-CTERM sorting domain-containing protein [Opitutales bacterium]|nr:PEP-CTERM sorting domain-containing protein [Opitutales bacterium]
MKAKITYLSILGLSAFLLPVFGQVSVEYDFNDENDLGWNGVTNDSNELYYTADGGLNDSGAVFRNDSDGRNAFMVTTDSFDGSLGTLTMSLFFQAGDPGRNENAENRASQMGFRTDQVSGNSDIGAEIHRLDESPNSVFVSMFPQNGSEVNLRVGTMDNTGSFSSNVAVTLGDWYYWTSTFTLDGQNSWDITSEIFDATDTGTVGNSLLSTEATGLAGPDKDDFETVFGSIGIGENDPGNRDSIRIVDDVEIQAIPEPSTYAAILGLGALGMLLLRRKLRK